MLPFKLFLSLLNFSSASLHSPLSLFPSLTSHLSLSHSHIHLRHINHFSLINIYPFLPMQEYSFWLFNILITSRTINLILLLTLPEQTYFHEKKSNEINVYIQCNFISIKKRLYFKTLIFCEKIKIYGFDSLSCSWFMSFLTGRSQQVKIGRSLSSHK